MINQILDYPKKNSKAKFSTKTFNKSKIIFVYCPMNISYQGKNYKVPMQINISQRLPYEPPQVYLEQEKCFIVNKIIKILSQINLEL